VDKIENWLEAVGDQIELKLPEYRSISLFMCFLLVIANFPGVFVITVVVTVVAIGEYLVV
jgi:hypothetical protein